MTSLTAVDDDGIQQAATSYASHKFLWQFAQLLTQYLSKSLGVLRQIFFLQNLR
jgi:hypothetical protein